jgi:hypothetical protein
MQKTNSYKNMQIGTEPIRSMINLYNPTNLTLNNLAYNKNAATGYILYCQNGLGDAIWADQPTYYSSGQLLYFDVASSGSAPVSGTLLEAPNTASQNIITYTFGVNDYSPHLVGSFLAQPNSLDSTFINAGQWNINMFCSVSDITPNKYYYVKIYYVDSDGVSNPYLLADGSGDLENITSLLPTNNINTIYVDTAVIPDLSKRIKIELWTVASTGGTTSGDMISFYFRSTTNSFVQTTLNAYQVGPTGPTGSAGLDGNTGPTGPTGSTDINSITGLPNLLSIQNTPIPATAWNFISSIDQYLGTGSNVTFNNIVGTLTTAAQPYITSIGTLNGLTMGGNINLNNNTINGGGVNSSITGVNNLNVVNATISNLISTTITGVNDMTTSILRATTITGVNDMTTSILRATTITGSNITSTSLSIINNSGTGIATSGTIFSSVSVDFAGPVSFAGPNGFFYRANNFTQTTASAPNDIFHFATRETVNPMAFYCRYTGSSTAADCNFQLIASQRGGAACILSLQPFGGRVRVRDFLMSDTNWQNLSNLTQNVSITGVPTFSSVTINGGNSLRLNNTTNTFYSQFKSNNTSNVTYTLPTTDGTNGQILSTNGVGTLSWQTGANGATGPTGPSGTALSSFSCRTTTSSQVNVDFILTQINIGAVNGIAGLSTNWTVSGGNTLNITTTNVGYYQIVLQMRSNTYTPSTATPNSWMVTQVRLNGVAAGNNLVWPWYSSNYNSPFATLATYVEIPVGSNTITIFSGNSGGNNCFIVCSVFITRLI